jgi:hypothetical protein
LFCADKPEGGKLPSDFKFKECKEGDEACAAIRTSVMKQFADYEERNQGSFFENSPASISVSAGTRCSIKIDQSGVEVDMNTHSKR